MIADCHAHFIVPEITRGHAAEEVWRPQVRWEGNQQIIEFAGKEIRSALRPFADPEGMLQAMDEADVDRILLSPWVSLLRYEVEADEGVRSSRIQNEGLAAVASAHPDRIAALGTVPLQDPTMAARELEALLGTEGVVGVEVAASVRGEHLGHERFLPFWEAADALGAIVFIHPTTRGFNLPVFHSYYLWNSVGNPLETTITAAHMIMAGLMERFRGMKVVLAHTGGAILALRGRLRHAHSFQPQARLTLQESPDESMRRFYYDTITHDPALLQQAVDFVGAGQVLLGSDYPFDMGVAQPAESLDGVSLTPEERKQVLGSNLAQLVGWEI